MGKPNSRICSRFMGDHKTAFPYVNPLAIDITQAEGLRYGLANGFTSRSSQVRSTWHALDPKPVYWQALWACLLASLLAKALGLGLLTSRLGRSPSLMSQGASPLQGLCSLTTN